MTLDPQEIAHWIRFCVGFLEFADTVDPNVLVPVLRNYINDDPKLEDIINLLGMPREAKYFADADGIITDQRLVSV